MMCWLIGLACQLGPALEEPRLQDQSLYQQALRETDPERAIALCEQISDLPLRGECVVFEAGEYLKAGGDGSSACLRLGDANWQAVCLFEMVDAGKLRGEEALRMCKDTGPFIERCLAHALQREENALARQFPAGQEGALQAHIGDLLKTYGLDAISEEPIDAIITGRIIADRFRRSGRDRLFSLAVCGTANEVACVEAYRVVVMTGGRDARAPSDCTPPIDRDQVSALGFPVWEDDAQGIADQVWAHQCRRARGRHKVPPDTRRPG
jgi:hypothetical protein